MGPSCCYELGRSSCARASCGHARFRGPPDRVCMVRKHVTRGIQRMPVGGGPATHAYPPTVSLCPRPHAPIHTRAGRGCVGGQCCRPSEANLAPRRGSRDVERSLRRVPPAGATSIPPAPHPHTHPRRGYFASGVSLRTVPRRALPSYPFASGPTHASPGSARIGQGPVLEALSGWGLPAQTKSGPRAL
jgi:hypothetical protein